MQLVRPKVKIQRVYVTATDPDTRKSKSVTVYEATPDDVLRKLGVETETKEKKSRRPATAAAA